jgi:membrane-associated phospholipid phosphatase
MDPLLEMGLNATRWLQENYPQLAGFFTFISTLGLEEFYLALFPLVYWSISKPVGKLFTYLFLLTNALNPLLKHGLRGPRPYWLDPDLMMWEESSYGVPSGHVQLATVTYLFMAGWIRRWWAWVLAIVMIFLMAVSRVYLGSHFIHDTVVGFLVSGLVLLGFVFWQQYAAKGFGRRILGFKLMVAVAVPVAFGIVYAVVRLLIGAPDMSVPWAAYIPVAELAGVEGMATAVGTLLGVGIGFLLEASRVRFRSDGSAGLRIGRYVLGMVIALAIRSGLDLVFPADPMWLAIPLRILRYFLVGIWMAYYAPLFFVRFKLAQADPDPGIDLTIS